jgi:hypothetical protein
MRQHVHLRCVADRLCSTAEGVVFGALPNLQLLRKRKILFALHNPNGQVFDIKACDPNQLIRTEHMMAKEAAAAAAAAAEDGGKRVQDDVKPSGGESHKTGVAYRVLRTYRSAASARTPLYHTHCRSESDASATVILSCN